MTICDRHHRQEASSRCNKAVREQIYDLRKQQLDLKINDVLLEQETLKRKITSRALIDAEVAPKAKPVLEADAQKLYEENKARIRGEFAQIKPQLIQYLERQESRQAELAFAEQLRKQATIEVFLKQPEKEKAAR